MTRIMSQITKVTAVLKIIIFLETSLSLYFLGPGLSPFMHLLMLYYIRQ